MYPKDELKTIENKVEYCLQKHEQTRNSDKSLYNAFLVEFYREFLVELNGGWVIPIMDLYDIPPQSQISRARRRIQNDKRKYPPTDIKIAKKRGWLEEEYRQYYKPINKTLI